MATRIPWLPLSCGIAALGALRLGFTSHVDNLHSRRFSRSRRSSETQTLYFLSLVGFVRGRECATSRWAAFVCAADRCAMRPSNPSHQHIPSAAHEARLLRAAEAQRRRFCGASAALLLLWRFCQRSRSAAEVALQKRHRSASAALLLLSVQRKLRFCFCGASASVALLLRPTIRSAVSHLPRDWCGTALGHVGEPDPNFPNGSCRLGVLSYHRLLQDLRLGSLGASEKQWRNQQAS